MFADGQVPPFSGLVTLTMAFFLTYIVLRSLTTEQEHFISWNEFQHDMLAKGEVRQIVRLYVSRLICKYTLILMIFV